MTRRDGRQLGRRVGCLSIRSWLRGALGLFHLATGGWLMYLAYAVAVDFAIGYHWRV